MAASVLRFLLLIASCLCGVAAAAAQTSPAASPDGAGLYRAYCASCHGTEGRGDGPVASAMRKQPPNITLLAKMNGGAFPQARIRRIVEGREVSSHGTREMPVWGDIFMVARDGGSAHVSARIDAIIRHLETLQTREAQ
jgi:mono/diheme cytochrome c family protein